MAAVLVGRREIDALESAAYVLGVPLRVCNAPRNAVLAAQSRHRRARKRKRGHKTLRLPFRAAT